MIDLLYYASLAATAGTALLLHLLRLEVWPAPERPHRALLYVLLGNLWIAANLVWGIYLSLAGPIPLVFEGLPWMGVGLALVLVGLAISVWAWWLFRRLERLFGVRIDRLVTVGPYRYVRHPQYFALMLMTLGLSLIFNTLQLLLFALSTTAAFYISALMEERKLLAIFGQQYRDYAAKTPRFIPRLKSGPER
jgi:protein-S-isoprenylcysteine O-methyltransferase Ste14